MSKLSNISNFFYTKPTDAKVASFAYTDAEGKNQDGSAVTLTAGKVSRTVIFDPEKKNYQILKPTGLSLNQRVVVLDGKKNEFVAKPISSTLDLKGWKSIKGGALEDEAATKAFASNVVEKAINFKASRFFRWSAQSVSSGVSKAYSNLNGKKVALFATGALLAVGAYWVYTNPSACETKLKEFQEAAIHDSKIANAWFGFRAFIGF
ncbi:MAG: hypothetical protein K1060chlam3_00042 [Candidatus Anoxychlamydiales bacterium]|nr:hypothetical protein [Candidatus Anoxychlamydiales bacterium]